MSMACQGPRQSAQRAELQAVWVVACRLMWAPTCIITDSKFVHDGMIQLLRGGALASREHTDLWGGIRAALAARPADY
eukprot:279658-Alexandrium_andersonii.AAC.1